ncbi:phospholipase D-like domain-containing protein [Planococcus halocryophilus]|uniref:phospholipase D-like domain-containing protein n=1 Tax=Planococcus halocryophilus TaxID=1215089 RepID=UPI001F10A7B8|nr:phospholipase D-like domain-containing protein [Planococcus halocryophilus]MCH4827099.1 phospholipase D-like domain-containing protein [Planococcus halocryophilus]
MRKPLHLALIFALMISFIAPGIGLDQEVQAATTGTVAINEVAWMGTSYSYNSEWIELHNTTNLAVDINGWTLRATDSSPEISLSGSIAAGGYYLLERTNDNTVAGVAADLIYTGALDNGGEILELRDSSGVLIDSADAWYAGDNTAKATMERADPLVAGTEATNWIDSTKSYDGGNGTPRAVNSKVKGSTDRTEHLNNVSEAEGAINVYFNKCADVSYASSGNEANYNVNLETRLIERLNQATTSIDFATYEINLPGIVDALIAKAAEGIDVRVIADAKDAADPNYVERFKTMRLQVEKMVRGQDGKVGTADDIYVFSDSPMFAVEDSSARTDFGLPATPEDFPLETVAVGNSDETGYLFVEAEEKSTDAYYSPGTQMHNKFAVIDNRWVFTGSWNFTVTGLYGTETNMEQGVLDGNQQHVVEINWPALADVFRVEFDEMWGSYTLSPDSEAANFNTRKIDNTIHEVDVNGKIVEIYFSAGDDAVGKMREFVRTSANVNTYFTIFAWSDQGLVDELKNLWEGSYNDLEGTLTGFDIKGVFDQSFWNQWWSASVDMTGRTASQESVDNPNTRWANPAPVYTGNESRKLHSKTMMIDADTNSDPTVIVGSTNWSNNGNNINDENLLFIHDGAITNQFVQEFNVRYTKAGGAVN